MVTVFNGDWSKVKGIGPRYGHLSREIKLSASKIRIKSLPKQRLCVRLKSGLNSLFVLIVLNILKKI